MRELTSHQVNGLNECIKIEVLDDPGQGNACHNYRLSVVLGKPDDPPDKQNVLTLPVFFQNGPILESGVNGISNESLLAVVRDRLEGFQSGPFAHVENGNALADVVSAMECLKRRTSERVTRGVEGTHTV